MRESSARRATKTSRYLLSVVSNAPDIIVVCDSNGLIEYANPAFERITGHCADEVRGLPVAAVLRNHTGAPTPSGEGLAGSRLAGAWEGDVVERSRDGSTFEAHLTISPVRGADDTVIGHVYVGTDRSKERELESQLNWAARMASVGQLAEGVAHDFNNMLTAIRGYAELVRGALPAGSDSAADIEQVVLAADRATELTRQLLLFARKTSVEAQTLDPAEIVEAIAPMLRRLLGEHIELTVSAAAGVGNIRANPAQLEQVVLNLAVNARDAMPDGGHLGIQTVNVEIDGSQPRGRSGPAGHYVLLTVSDTGVGMSEETAARIFDPSFTTKPIGQGTGMGLATVSGIVKMSGGWIEVDTAPSKGTSFRVYFPQVSDVLQPGTSLAAHGTLASGSETVLLVEDDPAVRHFAARCLTELGYEVVEARTGDEAVSLVAGGKRVDLVVSDVVMPGMQGAELRRRLRELRPGLRTLFVSGFARGTTLSFEDETGLAYLAKPYNMESLAGAVRTLLDLEA